MTAPAAHHRRARALPGQAELRHSAVSALAVALAATCLHALLTGNDWYPAVLLMVLVVGTVGAAARWARLPVLAVVVVQLAAGLLTLTGLYAGRAAPLGFLPGPAALSRLSDLSDDGLTALRTVLFPTDATDALRLLAVGAVGVVAVAVDALAVGTRRPTFAGLPLVLLIAVPAAIRERSVGYLPLLAAAVGFLLLLSLDAEERTERWGRVLPARGPAPTSTAAGNAAPALQLGLAALALAVVVPVAIPGAHTSPFTTGAGAGPGGSRSSAQIIDPLVSVSTQLRQNAGVQLLTVRAPAATYLRLTALENFSDAGFTLGPISAPTSARVSRGIAPPADTAATSPTTPLSATIQASSRLAENLLPVPAGTTAVSVDGDWRLSEATRTIFSSNDTTAGRTWTVQAAAPDPTPALLAAGGGLDSSPGSFAPALLPDLQTPTDLPPEVGQTAREWIGTSTTAYAAAVAIQRHFTDGSFRYDTSVAFDAGPAGFTQFLAQRDGFCEQYATTMTAMMRTLGVPARVAIGFTGGTSSPDGTFTVAGRDAHAWPEVWFSGAGWVRFEPTPRTDGLATQPAYTAPARTGTTGPGTTGTTPTPAPQPGASSGAGSLKSKLDQLDNAEGGAGAATAPAPAARRAGTSAGVVLGLVVVGLLAALAALPGLLTPIRRRRRLVARGAGAAEGIWTQLLTDAADRGVPVRAGVSPRATGQVLMRSLPRRCADPVAALVSALERARYAAGAGAVDGAAAGRMADQVRTVRRALDGELSRPRWVWVRVAPVSGRELVGGPMAGAMPALLDRVDRVIGRRRRTRSAG